jgi:hypothetical protein
MADARSKFRRPETPPTTILGPDAESFVRGTAPTPEVARIEPPPEAQNADQAEGKSAKPEAMKRLTIDIPMSLHKRVKSQCANQGTTIADVVRAFLERKFPEAKP